ncbi:MAG: S41 family peptidase [Sphingomonadaceae bacterium]
MRRFRAGTALAMIAMLAACGGDNNSTLVPVEPPPIVGPPGTPPPAPSPTPTTAGCSLAERQNWVEDQIYEWYLFPSFLPANPSPGGFTTVQDYIDHLTAAARQANRDRFFTYITSIEEENAFFQSGQSAGFGIRLALDTSGRRLFITEAFEGAPALEAGIDRGTEILAIGTSQNNLRDVDEIIASEGSAGLNEALGPSTAGTTRVFRISDAGGTRVVSVTKREYTLLPVSPRYGVEVINDGGKKVGYLNLRTFIDTADPELVNAFSQFRQQGINEVIIDLRYNGGGLVSTAELMGDLMGGNRSTSDVFSRLRFRDSKSQHNETEFFEPRSQSISPTKIAFIGTGGSASASELVMNAFVPYLGDRAALVGTNTFGKPVGQIAIDKQQCDDRLRVVAFQTENAAGVGDYYNGLAPKMEATCQASDDISLPLGDPGEASIATALDFLAGRSCSAISGGGVTTQGTREKTGRELLRPARPNTMQREVPGAY